MEKKEALYSFSSQDMETISDTDAKDEKDRELQHVAEIPIEDLHDFKNHPFHVEMNTSLYELMKSIEKEGVLVPALARPHPCGNGYELIADIPFMTINVME